MRRELAIVAVALAAGVGACGGQETPLRIGVVVDCMGINRSLKAAEVSGAQHPLLARGAELRGDMLTGARVAGRRVELVPACTEALEFSVLERELRRLAEDEKVDAIVAAGTGPDEIVMRDVARTHPGVTFVAVVHGPREVTLHRPAPNLYRFVADYAQGVAGLATYAYRTLGWRTASVVAYNWDLGWASRDAFATEFCSLGGRVVDQVLVNAFDPKGGDVRRLRHRADGIAVFAPWLAAPVPFLRRLAGAEGDAARRVVLGPGVIDDPRLLAAASGGLDGVVGSSNRDPERLRAFVARHATYFPGIPGAVAASEAVTGYSDAVEGVLEALERAGGRPERLRAELGHGRTDLLGGPVRLDDRRQAVVSTSLVRVDAADGAPVTLRRVGERAGVDQSLGGLLPDDLRPRDGDAACGAGA